MPDELKELVLQLTRENFPLGYRRIQSELRKLGWRCSHGTLRLILRLAGLGSAPQRSRRAWREFLAQHGRQLLESDLFTVETAWLARLYFLFFQEIGSRRVHYAGLHPPSHDRLGSAASPHRGMEAAGGGAGAEVPTAIWTRRPT